MKKTFCFVLAILVCAALAVPALAADSFVPSITYKGAPDMDGAKAEGTTLDCLRIISVAEAKRSNTEEADLLVELYEKLVADTMELPYEKVEGIDADKMVIRELVSISCTCDKGHDEVTLTLDLGVAADAKVVVMGYENGEWVPVDDVVNNGDGTVTFTVKVGPVAIAVEA